MVDLLGVPSEPEGGRPSGACGGDLGRLLERAAGGDEAAFVAVYDATSARSFGLAAHLLQDADDAHEAVHAAYLHLWTHAACYDSAEGSPISWILAVVHERAVSLAHSEEPVPGSPPAPARPGPAPARPVCDDRPGAASYDVRSAWAALSVTRREAVDLAWFGGSSCSHVASLKGLPMPAVASAIRDGLLELRHLTRDQAS